jgi:hypothetical protein
MRALLYVSIHVKFKLVRACKAETVTNVANKSPCPRRVPIQASYPFDRVPLYRVRADDALAGGV